jgi:hypothetical protein
MTTPRGVPTRERGVEREGDRRPVPPRSPGYRDDIDKENHMKRVLSQTGRLLVVGAAVLGLAAAAAAQPTQTKETVPGGAATVKTVQVKGTLVASGTNWLIAKDPTGYYQVYGVKPGRKFIVDGVSKNLAELQMGTFLTATAVTTETPVIHRTTTVTKGKVFWASPTSVIVTLENGENKQYAVPSDFKFDVEGKKLSAMELRPGMKLTGTKIVEEPAVVISQDVVVTGTAPK